MRKIEIEVYSVDEKLPDNHGAIVMCWHKTGQIFRAWRAPNGNWIDTDSEFVTTHITHWCELPNLNEVS